MSSVVTAYKGMIRNFTMTFASITLVTLTLLVFSFMIVLSVNTNHLAETIFNSLNIYAYTQETIEESQLEGIKEKIKQIDGIDSVEVSTKEQELEIMAEGMPNDELVYEYFSGDDNPLNHLFIVQVVDSSFDIKTISQQLLELEEIQTANFGEEDGADKLLQTLTLIRYGTIAIVAVLLVSTIFLIANTIKLTIASRRKEIQIMRLVGGTKWFIRFPFILEGVFIGIIGGCIALIGSGFVYNFITSLDIVAFIQNNLLGTRTIVINYLLYIPLVGAAVGTIASLSAIRSYLRT